MLDRERQRLILKWVQERSVVAVSDLVELLEASEATIRRDINTLAERGEVRRVRGGAEAMNPRHQPHLAGRPFELSLGIRAAQKQAIARAAAGLIGPGESIIIGGGTTTFRLAECLEEGERDVLTNSFPVAARLLVNSRHRVTLPGGRIYREHSIVLSPFDDLSTRHFWAAKLFAGCHGVNRFGILETDPLIVQSMVKLLDRAEEVIVLADSSKLGNRSSMIVAPLSRISTLITDDGARPEDLAFAREAGLRVIVAAVDEAEIDGAVAAGRAGV